MIAASAAVHLADRAEGVPRRPGRGQPAPPGRRARPVAAGHAPAVGCGPRPRRRPGRNYAMPDDVKSVAVPALAHRLVLRADRGARMSAADAIGEVLAEVPVPVAR